MINLFPWREQQLIKKKRQALSAVLISYLLLFGVSSVFFMKGYHKKNDLVLTLQQLNNVLKQRQVNTNELISTEKLQQQLTMDSSIVWQRYQFIEKTIRLILHVPHSLVLSKLHCVENSCEMELTAHTLDGYDALVPNYHVQDLKQGECPLCYQARVSVNW